MTSAAFTGWANLDEDGRRRHLIATSDNYGGEPRVEERIARTPKLCAVCDQAIREGDLYVCATIGRGAIRVDYPTHPPCMEWPNVRPVAPARAWKAVQRVILEAGSPEAVPAWALARIAPRTPF